VTQPMTNPLLCPYCNRAAKFVSTSGHIYGRDYGPVWDCRKCDAYVGCHPDGSPKGTLANFSRREARKAAHALFDPLWQNWQLVYPDAKRQSSRMRQTMRTRAYEWLANALGMQADVTHIAMFDEAQCARAVELLKNTKPTSATVRSWAKQSREAA
jgi:hypothetical protein